MATPRPDATALRRGLPRRPGGDPWPPADAAPVASAEAPEVAVEAAAGVTAAVMPLRRGLPRVAGGDPWPPASASAAIGDGGDLSDGATSSEGRQNVAAPSQESGATETASVSVSPTAPTREDAAATTAAGPAHDGAPGAGAADAGAAAVRRGLPRVAGGEAWPPAGTIPAATPNSAGAPTTPAPTEAPVAPAPTDGASSSSGRQEDPAPSPQTSAIAPTPAPATAPAPAPATADRAPLTVPRTVWPGRAAYHRPAPRPEPVRVGPFTRGQWIGALLVGGAGLLLAAGMAVALVRVILSLPAMQDFLAAYPGEYHLPDAAPVGIPAWIGWQHFFNAFFMLLIIRTGLQIRTEKRPTVFWTPRRDRKGKTSLTIWFHQALDLLWLVNGVIFVVLLFATGQWMRIVPTSWEVFPNALSAVLQYVSLDWPTENGWVNYNSLQQLAYFTTVFVAAPLAAVTGFRMGGLWPKKNARLNAAYPIEWARKVHFPVMLYFVAFIVVHVALVFATGALRNLNHMYAAQGSVDGVAYADNWAGFWIFVASVAVMVGGWIAARPLVIAPIAKLFGTVSGR
ncbi:cytochrome b/b6 domain-containing protein [Microbacterium sp. LjRoot45]|uniref:cytochrome b/b6 domain-containing protein n=1 Tax=Microbacterium sp. LjRoot45 TaxID=3342329 RepID=UPI003ECD9088